MGRSPRNIVIRTTPVRWLSSAALVVMIAASGCTSGGNSSTPTPAATSSSVAPPTDAAQPIQPAVTVRDDLAEVFTQAGTTGTFVLYDVNANRLVMVDPARAETPMVPASTFKVPHSLIALETGVVPDVTEKIPYGGQPQPIKEWEQDMGLADAVRVSNVPVFQEIARRIGAEREREWMLKLGYGNAAVGANHDRFWLDGPLQISARDQAVWLSRLAQAELPATPANQRLVRDIFRQEPRDGGELFAKTGWARLEPTDLGWWVGWVERNGSIYSFALNLDVKTDADAEKRIPIGLDLLHRLDVFDN